jgi:hypothetical protein
LIRGGRLVGGDKLGDGVCGISSIVKYDKIRYAVEGGCIVVV